MTSKVTTVFTNEDKILVKVLKQDKGHSSKKWSTGNFLINNGCIQHWTDYCGDWSIGSAERKYGIGKITQPAWSRTLTLLKSFFKVKKMHLELRTVRHFEHKNDIIVNLTFPILETSVFLYQFLTAYTSETVRENLSKFTTYMPIRC